MAKPKSKPQLSLDPAHIFDQAVGIPHDHWSRLFFEQIYCPFDDADFTDLYEQGRSLPDLSGAARISHHPAVHVQGKRPGGSREHCDAAGLTHRLGSYR